MLFAGLVDPGLYQFNVIVPASAGNGDLPITAQYSGFITPSLSLLNVKSSNPPVLQNLTFDSISLIGQGTEQGTVTISGPAPAGGTAVALASSNPSWISVPSSVAIAEGESSATFPLTYSSSNNQGEAATITAGYAAGSAAVVVVVSPTNPPFENLICTCLFQPLGTQSFEFMIESNADGTSYTANLGGFLLTNGTASNQNTTFTFNTVANAQPGGFYTGTTYVTVTSAALSFTASAPYAGVGSLTGTLSVTGTPYPGGGAPVTVAGPVSGRYTTLSVPIVFP